MTSAREIRSMPDPASDISTICGSIASYFGIQRSGTMASRQPRDAFLSISQPSRIRTT
jgi:hypothetical protein